MQHVEVELVSVNFPTDVASKKKKNSFKNIFLGGSKFQKSLKRYGLQNEPTNYVLTIL